MLHATFLPKSLRLSLALIVIHAVLLACLWAIVEIQHGANSQEAWAWTMLPLSIADLPATFLLDPLLEPFYLSYRAQAIALLLAGTLQWGAIGYLLQLLVASLNNLRHRHKPPNAHPTDHSVSSPTRTPS